MKDKSRRRHYFQTPHHDNSLRWRTEVQRDLVRTYDKGFNAIVKLKEHSSCVNAVAFSKQGGQWLATGGDDRRIVLWNMHDDNVSKPVHTFTGSTANIFEISFSCQNNYVFCGGVDTCVRRYPMARVGQSGTDARLSEWVFREHEGSIRAIATHPFSENLFITAAEDGDLYYHDIRQPKPAHHLKTDQEIIGALYHPRMENSILVGQQRGADKLCLLDVRKFGESSTKYADKVTMKYATQPIGRIPLMNQPSSIAFDRTGERFVTVNIYHCPTIYTLNDPLPIAICSGKKFPDGSPVPTGQKSYVNRSTIKHASFGGPGLDDDSYLATGSEDYRGYVWKLPPTSELLNHREQIEDDDGDWDPPEGQIGYVMSGLDKTLTIPVELDRPEFRLGGHKSIVNSALFHPELPRIATCGIESKVIIHSPFKQLEGAVEIDPDQTRKRWNRNTRVRIRRGMSVEGLNESDRDDAETIAWFDQILSEEDEGDVDVHQTDESASNMMLSFDDDDVILRMVRTAMQAARTQQDTADALVARLVDPDSDMEIESDEGSSEEEGEEQEDESSMDEELE